MDNTTKIVQDFYDANPQKEWDRIAGRPEFLLTSRMLNRYISPGDKVLDIGGGPGRYTMYLAEKGCNMTLVDLSPENVKFAEARAAEQGLKIKALAGDAREADVIVSGERFDHILLMGPLYHLLEESGRTRAVEAALNLLKPGGKIFVSFITMSANLIYYLKDAPELVLSIATSAAEAEWLEKLRLGKSFAGDAFTKAFFTTPMGIRAFMRKFPFNQLHLFGQEGIIEPREGEIMSQSPEVVEAWLVLSEKLYECEDLLSWAEHLMYVGEKR